MATKYKVWLHVERGNEDRDTYEDVGLPEQIGEFRTLREAEQCVSDTTAARSYQAQLLQALDKAVASLDYLAPETFDSEAHKREWHRAMERYRAILANARRA